MKSSIFIPSWETLNKKHIYQFEYFATKFDKLYLIGNDNFSNIEKIKNIKKTKVYLNKNFFMRLLKYFTFLLENKSKNNIAVLSPYGLSSILFFLLSKIFFLKIISIEWGVIDVYKKKFFLEKFFIYIIFKYSNAIWFKEPYMKEKLKFFKNKKLYFIHNAIKPLNKNSQKQLSEKSIDFLWVNRFADNRTPEIPIKALLELKGKYSFKAVFLGDISNEYSYLNKYKEFSVYKYSDPKDFYNISKFFVGSGPRYFGNNALIEAMNNGLIPIVNNSENITEIIDNKINGFICENNVKSFSEQLIFALNLQKKDINSLSDLANKKILNNFSNILWEKKIDQLLSDVNK